MLESSPNPATTQRRRQRRILIVLGGALLAGGAVVLLFLTRIPLPLRLLVGFTDVVGGLALLLVAHQKFAEQ